MLDAVVEPPSDEDDGGVVGLGQLVLKLLRPDIDSLPLLDLDVLPTLSFRGPVWRSLDATLIVEGGVGSLCKIPADQAVPDLATCDGGAVETAVRSSQPDITSWFFGPVIAEFDELGEVTQVVPLGGRASRNDSAG